MPTFPQPPGGKPSTNWDLSFNTEPETPYCYQPTGTTNQLKIHTVVTKGFDRKFGFCDSTSTYSLNAFASAVWTHLRACGMDLVFYFLLVDDESSTGKMVDIIFKHSRFFLSSIQDTVTSKKVSGTHILYDKYVLRNLASARTFLFQSLTNELQNILEQKMTNKTTGPELWMMIIDEIQSNSVCRYQLLCEKLRTLCFPDFLAENICLFNQKCLTFFKESENADVMDDNLLLHLLDAYTKSTTEIFCVSFITQRHDLDLFLRTVKGRSSAACCSITGIKLFSYSSLMDNSLSLYNSLLESGDWIAAVPTKQEKHSMASAFSNHKANLSVSSPIPKNAKYPITCYSCGKDGHISRDCSKPKIQRDNRSSTSKYTNSNGDGGRGGRHGLIDPNCGSSVSNNRHILPDLLSKAPDTNSTCSHKPSLSVYYVGYFAFDDLQASAFDW